MKFGRFAPAGSALKRRGVALYWTGEQAKQDPIGYTTARAKLNADFRFGTNLHPRASVAAEAW